MTDEAQMFIWEAWGQPLGKIEYDAVIAGVFRLHAVGSTPCDGSTWALTCAW